MISDLAPLSHVIETGRMVQADTILHGRLSVKELGDKCLEDGLTWR
jgi:hypothetical protein